MKKLQDLISDKMTEAFVAAGFDASYAGVTVSNRPDLCEFQCNGALAAAKTYHKAPIQIAESVVERLDSTAFSMAEAVKPGFINLKIADDFLRDYVARMAAAPDFGVEKEPTPKRVVVDYGGPNVAKPLHVGHLRSAIIGESVKRINRFFGNETIGDIHLGDWGLQMGLIVASLADQKPDLPYFDPDFRGEYPKEPPFTLAELEEIYPAASGRSKVDPDFAEKAHQATFQLQNGNPGYRALWKHIMNVSLPDIRRIYDGLDVHFEVWKGESDADPYIPGMIRKLKQEGFAQESLGALIFPVAEEADKKEVPPCILLKSDGSVLYDTTDLATMVQREQDYHPDRMIYLADKRQALHFEQVFRAARKSGIVRPETELHFLGFGTMNGKDGKPFKTRDGGVMRLETLISDVLTFVESKVRENQIVEDFQVRDTAQKIAMAALKYGDLSNAPTKDYVFDLDRFAAFEGNTGPYILYTIVRVKSILEKFGSTEGCTIQAPANAYAKDLMLAMTRVASQLELAYRDSAPNVICAYIYELAGAVNKFYHETRILTEEDSEKQKGFIALIALAKEILELCIGLLGFSAPDKM